jgi:hypothetical protein
MEEMEDILDARHASAAIHAGEATFPADFVKCLLSGKRCLKIWRSYRKLTLSESVKICGTSIPAVSRIASRKRTPDVGLPAKLAKVLQNGE